MIIQRVIHWDVWWLRRTQGEEPQPVLGMRSDGVERSLVDPMTDERSALTVPHAKDYTPILSAISFRKGEGDVGQDNVVRTFGDGT